MSGTGYAYDLLVAASGTSATGAAVSLSPGIYCFYVDATAIGGGTVTFQGQARSGGWLTVPGTALTASGMVLQLYLPAGQYRAILTGATAASGINASVVCAASI